MQRSQLLKFFRSSIATRPREPKFLFSPAKVFIKILHEFFMAYTLPFKT